LKIKVVIADDEPLARQLLERLVCAQPEFTVAGIAENGIAAERMIAEEKPDLVFLDINMPEKTGVELTETLHAQPITPLIVFVTAFDRFAAVAYDLDVLDYLVKPISKARFSRAVERARNAIAARRSSDANVPYVVVKRRDELIRVAERDIYWLEAASQYVHIHTADDSFVVAEPLKRYFSRLSSPDFKRVHRSAVVNIRKVSRILRKANGVHELELANGVGVSLARSRKMMLEELLGASAGNPA
jgi:two-component system, LytTR family, response regulator